MRFPNFPQLDSRDCGPTCLQIICKYFGKYISIEKIRKLMNTGKDGSSIYDFIEAASALEINCLPYSISYWKFRHEVQLPCVVLWNRNHFIVVYKITKKYIFVSDPAFGLCKYTLAEFAHGWLSYDTNESKTKRGICITCEPTIRFSDIINDKQSNGTLAAIQFVWAYMKQYKKQVIQIISILLLITSLSATFPLFTQSIIDTGIPNQDRNFILLMLIAYISLSIGKAIGTWLHSSVGMKFAARMKVSMISDYIIRLFQMPLNFFENRLMGDIIQRNADFDRIESMTINSFFASILGLFSLLIFGTILFVYQETLFWVFLAGGTLYVLWVLFFWSLRKKMDIRFYSLMAKNQSQWIEFLTQVSDIKNYRFSDKKRWIWESNQVKLYKTRIKLLHIDQIQNLGSSIINSFKDAILIYLSASSVIKGDMTLGMMTAVQYILGQLTSPLDSIVNFIVSLQLCTISHGRITDIQKIKAEEELGVLENNISLADYSSNLKLNNVYFKYNGDNFALKNISMILPYGKVTAIVGESGCGKSTLLKVLSGLYQPANGEIYLGDMKRTSISLDSWRKHCGIITQESILSRDTIYNNIVFGREPNDERIIEAASIANIRKEIEMLPNAYDTIIGENGRGVSEGQKQRILLARALYGSPNYLFLDEMTSSLDTRNEESIVKMLKDALPNKSICIVSHRKQTIMSADMIIVMKNGSIVEVGTHEFLINRKGEYYNLFYKE